MVALEKIESFGYPAAPDVPAPAWDGWAAALLQQAPVAETEREDDARIAPPKEEPADCEQRLHEEKRSAFEAGREQGRQEGCMMEREAQAAVMAGQEALRRQQAAALLERFAEARDRYLEAVESEVVRLALAVAARILRREAQMDPLLLSGAVRVALRQLAGTTEVRLRVPVADLDLWREAIRHMPNLALKPSVEAGESMRLGDCVIESAIGSVDLGVRTQLEEIERGFFDHAPGNRIKPSAEPGAGPREGAS